MNEPQPEGQPRAGTTRDLKPRRSAESDAITKGAENCPDCANPPLGIKHDENAPKPFEVGCIVCKDHRARANSPQEAVAKWNAGEYLPPK